MTCPSPTCPALDIQVERDRLARRVDSLWRQRKGLVKLLAQIEKNGGVSPTCWKKIDRILVAAGIQPANQQGRVEVMQEDG